MLPLTLIPGGHVLPPGDATRETPRVHRPDRMAKPADGDGDAGAAIGAHREPHGNGETTSQAARPFVGDAGAGRRRDRGHAQQSGGAALPRPACTLMSLPPELREMIWKLALPRPRYFTALDLRREDLVLQRGPHARMPLAGACFESRRVLIEAGYRLGCQRKGRLGDTGVWVHPELDGIGAIKRLGERGRTFELTYPCVSYPRDCYLT